MPELPEVETIRRQLKETVVGKKIKRVEILEPKMFIGNPNNIVGKTITDIRRQAKVLQIILGDGVAMAIFTHFKLNGQFFWERPRESMPSNYTRIILYLDDGSKLLFNDSRKFAWMKVVEGYKEEEMKAIEPFLGNFTFDNLKSILGKSRKPIKVLLMDQEKIAGIGNIYANESLFWAKINPFRAANTLNEDEIRRLYEAILQILKTAIECKGSSGKDEWYRQINGKPGCYQDHFLVYQKNGEKCSQDCGGEIKRIKQAGRSTFYCPGCQK